MSIDAMHLIIQHVYQFHNAELDRLAATAEQHASRDESFSSKRCMKCKKLARYCKKSNKAGKARMMRAKQQRKSKRMRKAHRK